jgi:hypothetical protein
MYFCVIFPSHLGFPNGLFAQFFLSEFYVFINATIRDEYSRVCLMFSD